KFYHGSHIYFFDAFSSFTIFTDEQWNQYQRMIKEWIWDQNENKLMDWFSNLPAQSNYTVHPGELNRISRIILNLFMDHILSKYHVNLLAKEDAFKTTYNKINNNKVSNWEELYDLTFSAIFNINGEIYRSQNGWILKINQYIEDHYAGQLKLEDIAKHMNFSINYFSKKFQREMGMSFIDYLTQYRIQKAIEFLEHTDLSTEVIADRIGYQNPNYFIKVFKKITGETVTDYKRRKKL